MFPARITPQAVSAHKRSTAARAKRHAKRWGIFSDVMAQPAAPTFEEHRDRQRQAFTQQWREARERWAQEWRLARKRLRSMSRERAAELLAEWNAREDPRHTPGDLLQFLSYREPSEELLEHRRRARLQNSASHIEFARRRESWYVAHLTCPAAGHAAVAVSPHGIRGLHCLACDASWLTRAKVTRAETSGELAMIDCRRTEQLPLL